MLLDLLFAYSDKYYFNTLNMYCFVWNCYWFVLLSLVPSKTMLYKSRRPSMYIQIWTFEFSYIFGDWIQLLCIQWCCW